MDEVQYRTVIPSVTGRGVLLLDSNSSVTGCLPQIASAFRLCPSNMQHVADPASYLMAPGSLVPQSKVIRA
jgi:hypothetical protein